MVYFRRIISLSLWGRRPKPFSIHKKYSTVRMLFQEKTTEFQRKSSGFPAPTGSGKTSFVYDTLLPDALSKGKNLLLVSNRVALSTQQKRRIMEITHNPALKLLSAEGIKRAEDLGSVRVITYHRLPALCNDAAAAEWISNLGYAVFDEAHFFTSDSVFNENTEYFLRLSCERFCRATFIEEIWRSGDQTLLKLFRYSKGIVYPNKLAQYVLNRRWLFFKQILDGKTSFRAEVESWFGIKSDGITAVEQLDLFCRQNCETPLSGDSADHLRNLISRSCADAGFKEPQMKRKNCLKGVALTNRLAKIGLPYYVEDSKKTLIIHAKEDNIQND